jgi:hypothetical protein
LLTKKVLTFPTSTAFKSNSRILSLSNFAWEPSFVVLRAKLVVVFSSPKILNMTLASIPDSPVVTTTL